MARAGDKLLYLSSSDVTHAIAGIDLLACVREALLQHASGMAKVGVEGVLRWSPAPGQAARTLNMPGHLEASAIVGTKIINANTGNPAMGLPRADGLTILFEARTARPAAILQGAQISALRTAAVSTLAASHLHGSGPVRLSVIGAGKLAEAHIRLMAAHLDIDRILIHDQIAERAHALAAALSSLGSTAVAELEESVRNANILVTVTTATEAYVPCEWITPGTLIINVSLDDIDAETYMRADLLYVDDWQLITEDTQRLLGRLARDGAITGPDEAAPVYGRNVTGTIGQLLANACPSRESGKQTILVNPFGMAIEDLAVAEAVYAAATARGIGTVLER